MFWNISGLTSPENSIENLSTCYVSFRTFHIPESDIVNAHRIKSRRRYDAVYSIVPDIQHELQVVSQGLRRCRMTLRIAGIMGFVSRPEFRICLEFQVMDEAC